MKTTKSPDAGKASEPVLNQAMLDVYAKRKTGLLERLVAAYLGEAPTFHQNIRQGTASQAFDLVKLNAHALKSSSYNLGAIRLSKICQDMEAAAEQKDMASILTMVSQLGPECFEVEEALKTAVFRMRSDAAPAAPAT